MQSLGGVELTQCLLPTVFATGVEFVRNMVRFQVKKQGKRFPSLGVKIMPFGTVTPMMWHVTTEPLSRSVTLGTILTETLRPP